LREACLSEHGLVNDEIRKVAWPILLNVNSLYADDAALSKKLKYDATLREQIENFEKDKSWTSNLIFLKSFRILKTPQR
jgi:hypothetical protein